MENYKHKWAFRISGLILFFSTASYLLHLFNPLTFTLELNTYILYTHLISSLIYTVSICLFFHSKNTIFILSTLLLLIVFPIVGPVFYICIMIALSFSKKLDLLTDFHEESTAQNLTYENTETFEESIQKNVNVEPLVEVIRSHHIGTDLKRGAIETLTNMCDPISVTLLKECLSDPDSEVRFYASSGLSRIEENLNEQILKYKNKTSKPEATAKDFYKYGSAYYEFIYLGIQDHDSLAYYLDMSIQNYLIACQRNRSNKKFKDALQKAYNMTSEHPESKSIEEILKDENQDPIYEAETLFKSGKLKECSELLMEYESNWTNIKDVKELWARHNNES